MLLSANQISNSFQMICKSLANHECKNYFHFFCNTLSLAMQQHLTIPDILVLQVKNYLEAEQIAFFPVIHPKQYKLELCNLNSSKKIQLNQFKQELRSLSQWLVIEINRNQEKTTPVVLCYSDCVTNFYSHSVI